MTRVKSDKRVMRELPIAHLSDAKRRDLLLEVIDAMRDGAPRSEIANVFDLADVDVTLDEGVEAP